MTKTVTTLVITALMSVNAFAGECVDKAGNDISSRPEVFQQLIAHSASCYEASKLAQACAWGSQIDVLTADLGAGVCMRELAAAQPSKANRAFLAKMERKCDAKYARAEGTLYRSMNAYCRLSAIEWVLGVASPLE